MTQFPFFSDLAEELEQRQAIVKQFAKLIEFVLIFDERKIKIFNRAKFPSILEFRNSAFKHTPKKSIYLKKSQEIAEILLNPR